MAVHPSLLDQPSNSHFSISLSPPGRQLTGEIPECQIKRLPPELLSTIFMMCTDVNPTQKSPPTINYSPLKLGLVCRAWRELTLSCPPLWAQIHIKHDVHEHHRFTSDARVLDNFLARSEGCPLDITLIYSFLSFDLRQDLHKPAELKVAEVVAKIVPHAKRWTTVTLYVPDVCIPDILSPLREGVPMLKSFNHVASLGRRWTPSPEYIGTISFDVTLMPQLAELGLDGVRVIWGDACHQGIWLVNWFSLSVEDFLQCLDRCPSLTWVNVSLDSRYSNPTLLTAQREIRNSRFLKQCRISAEGEVDMEYLLDRLQFPSLKILSIRSGFLCEWGPSSLVDFISRSQPPLEHLCIEGHIVNTDEWSQCLQLLPRLKSIGADSRMFPWLAEAFIGHSRVSGHTALCPQLDTMWLRSVNQFRVQTIEWRAAAKLVIHRWWEKGTMNAISRIGNVFLSCSGAEFLKCEGIQKCVDEGLVVKENVHVWLRPS